MSALTTHTTDNLTNIVAFIASKRRAWASAGPRLALGSAAEQSRGPTGLPRCRPSRDAAGNSSMRDAGGLRLPLCVGIVREHRPKAAGNKPEITKGHSGA